MCRSVLLPLLLFLAGCGEVRYASEAYLPESASDQSAGRVTATAGAGDPVTHAGINAAEANGADAIRRQIVYTARLSLVVEQFDGLPERVEQLAADHGGFVAGSNIQGTTGSRRNGSWTLRVPVERYGTFLESARGLGEFVNLTTSSEEVTAEYYDLQTRISGKQRQESRLLELLAESTGTLEDVLKVEAELGRIREEIERMQGRMRVLQDLTAFSTVILSVQEVRDYQPAAAPTFANRIGRTWDRSLGGLLTAGQNLVLAVVAITPWLVGLSIPVLLLGFTLRAKLRKTAV